MDKVYNIDEIFGSENVKVQAKLADNRCVGCYFWRNNPPFCFKPAYIGTCAEKGQRFIYIKINDKSLIKTDINTITHYKSRFVSVKDALPEQDEEVIVLVDDLNTSPNYKIAFGHIVNKERFKDYNGWNIPNVVYWFPMPKLPKKIGG